MSGATLEEPQAGRRPPRPGMAPSARRRSFPGAVGLWRDAHGSRARTLGVGRLDQARYRRQAATERLRRSPIRITLTRAGRRLLARRGGLPTTVSLKTDDLDAVRWTVQLSTR